MKALAFLVVTIAFTTSLSATDYYWVGGAGNWADISHWATTSGGVITHSQVPTADDDVYFDANSFTGPGQVVVINNENIFCLNMDWSGATGTPTFQGDASKVINIFGSLNFIPDMTFDFTGQVRFRAAIADTPVETAGHRLGNSVFFGGNGGWILQDSIVVDSLIQFSDGNLNTNSHNLEADYLNIDIQNSGSLTLGSSKITLHGQNIYYQVGNDLFANFVLEIMVMNVPFAIDPGSSVLEFTSNDAALDVQSTTPLQLNDIYFSNDDGTGTLSQINEPVNYGEVRFNNNGSFDFDMSAEHLILAPGKTYRFLSGFTYALEQITANGNCLGTITIQGTEGNNQTATFLSDGQNILLDYLNLKNISATGTSTYMANNSADLGNNTGWTITPRSVQNLYWVGGTGNWNDPNHWSLTSGGLGGACIPSGTDNVFFDINSFDGPGQMVTIAVDNAYCRSMDWTGAGFTPALVGDFDPVLHIFGSLTLIQDMNYWFGGLLWFESQNVGNTITTGNHYVNKIDFNGSGGEWVLQDSLRSETYISLVAGTLLTNGQYVESTAFTSGISAALRRLELGNTTWVIKHFPDAQKDQWNVNLSGTFELDAGTSTIDFQGVGGNFEHFSLTPANIEYNRVIFNYNVGFLDHFSPGINCTIDSLIFNHGGYFFDDFTVNTLILTPGYTYLLQVFTTQTIGTIVAPANCNQLITIRSDAEGFPANFNVLNNHPDLQYLSLRDVHSVGPGMLAAQNSIDQGNNVGWTIDELSSRTLYWVGGTGDWGDQAHWSLNSGGPGGECVPTLLDDVIFDASSFSGPGQEVQGFDYNGYYCRDITWEDNLPDPLFNLNCLYCYGSVLFSQNMAVQMPEGLYMNSAETETLRLNGQVLDALHIEGRGSFTLLDRLNTNVLFNHNGTFNTDGQPLSLGRWVIDNAGTQRVLNLGNSYITITEPADNDFFEYYSLEAGFSLNTTIDPGTSIIELTNPYAGALLSGGIRFNNIIFSGTDGLLNVCHAENSSSLNNPAYLNLLEIGGDAIVKGFHNIDTLLLAPGKSYRLEQDVTQTVNEYLQILGNNCNPIELFSTLPGMPATIFSSSAVVIGDFIQMRDQTATGGADFFAGTHSTDIDNSNQGWVFDSAPDYIDVGFFGPDQSICLGEPLELSAYNYSQGEIYEWSTGSTQASIPVTQAGTYWAQVTFGNMCEVVDTISITTIEPAPADLGPDAGLCEGESLLLDATSASPNVSYTWQDGSTEPTYEVAQGGDYIVELNKEGCLTSDTITIEVLELPAVTLGGARELCEGQSITLDASVGQPAAYLWQDGSTQPTLLVSQSGTYAVTVTANGCEGTDQATVTFNPLPSFSLGPDTSLCSGQSLDFNFDGLAEAYLWQDGATTASYTIAQGGQFWLQATDNGCTFADTLQLALFQTPEPSLGGGQELCEGQSITLDASVGQPAAYLWQDGATQPTLSVSQSGTYAVTVTANGCEGTDQAAVTFNPLPEFSLGPDTSLCSGQSLDFNFDGLAEAYLWQDGATTASYTISQGGQFWLQATDNGCTFADTLQVVLFQTPEPSLGGGQELCEGQSITLDASVGQPAAYLWQDGATQPTLSVSQSGTYAVTVTANGCEGTDQAAVTFNPLPEFSLGPDTSLCSGQSLDFNFDGLAEEYLWQDGATSANFTINEGGQFWMQASTGGCIFSDTVNVAIQPSPEVSLGQDRTLCEGEEALLEPSIGENDGFFWQDGSSASSILVDQSGIYWIEASLEECRSRDSVSIEFRPPPELALPDSLTLCSGEQLVLRPTLPETGDISWQDGSDSPEFVVKKEGTYFVSVTGDACPAADTVVVVASSCGQISVYVPNAFSPNEDGRNDLFLPYFDPDYSILDFELKVFDRWGGLTFSSEDVKEGWDGTIKGQKANTGLFVYLIRFTFEDNGEAFEQLVSGEINLIR